MTRARCVHFLCAIALFLAVGAAPVLAHGWVIPQPVAAYVPAGGAQSVDYRGPQGGGDPEAVQAEETSTPQAVTEPVAEPVAATPTPVASTLGPRASGPTTIGRSAAPSRPKSFKSAWSDRIRVDWTAAFPPASSNQGYAAGIGSIDDALRASPMDGGWYRDDAPSIVVVLDPANEKHVAALKSLDQDRRFVAASHLFNCFKVDARSLSKAKSELALRVHRTDGTLVGETKGRLHRAFDLLEKAWSLDRKQELTKELPRMNELVDGLAFFDHWVEQLERAIVCPDCGHERHDVIEKIADFRLRRESCARAIEAARSE